LFLKERLNRIQVMGVVAALLAIYLFNVETEGGFLSRWLMIALMPILLWGAACFLQKIATNHISGEQTTLWCLGAFVPFAAFLLIREPLPNQIAPLTWVLVIALGLFQTLGIYGGMVAFAAEG